jgi:hypothetical protein
LPDRGKLPLLKPAVCALVTPTSFKRRQVFHFHWLRVGLPAVEDARQPSLVNTDTGLYITIRVGAFFGDCDEKHRLWWSLSAAITFRAFLGLLKMSWRPAPTGL